MGQCTPLVFVVLLALLCCQRGQYAVLLTGIFVLLVFLLQKDYYFAPWGMQHF